MTIEVVADTYSFTPKCCLCGKAVVRREDLRMVGDSVVHAACAQCAQPRSEAQPHGEHEDHPLYPVLVAAIEQAMHGKGVRHGGAVTPFTEQPIFHYAKMHGRGFLTGQAAKKLEEAASTRKGDAFRSEVLGAIVYAAAAILWEEAGNGADA